MTSHKADSGPAAKSWSGIASEVLAHRGIVDSDLVAPTIPQPVAIANIPRCDGGTDEYSNETRADAAAFVVVASHQFLADIVRLSL